MELTDAGEISIHSLPYFAEPRTRAVKKVEIDRILKLDIIEPTQTKLAAISSSTPRRARKFSFLSTRAASMQLLSGIATPLPELTSA